MLPASPSDSILAADMAIRRMLEPALVGFAPSLQAATVATASGELITGAVARISQDGARWTAMLSDLDQPGLVASMYFSAGLRDVILRLADGRSARARITGTTFSASSSRTCELVGIDPLA
jgi:hypothetical protein